MSPRFDSPIGSKKFEGQPLREFEVPDESGPPAPPTQSRRQRQLEEATNMDLNAIRDFQAKMQASQMGNVREQLPPPQQSRFHGMGGRAVEDLSHSEREIREIREIQRGHGRLNEGARRRIEILLGMVRDSRHVDLTSGIYTLQTLRSQELREAIVATQPFDGTIQGPFEIRRQLLARSLVQIAGIEIDQFVGSSDLEVKLEVMDQLPEALLTRLFNEYNLMVAEARDKYAIKTEEDAKEVLQELKK